VSSITGAEIIDDLSMTDSNPPDRPSPFISRWVMRMAAEFGRGRALDVATGRGRHALAMAAAGFNVTGIDVQLSSLSHAQTSALAAGVQISLVCADLRLFPIPTGRFQVVVVARYLDRAIVPALRQALAPDGVLLYETFTENQLRYDRGPRSRDHLLRPGELRMLMRGMDVLFDEESTEPEAVARIVARRR
jgi:tellurite methyltransferase